MAVSLKKSAKKAKPFPKDVSDLIAILTYKRKHNSESELDFIQNWLLPRLPNPVTYADASGNAMAYTVTIPNADGSASRTMFSTHTDTCHHGVGKQILAYDAELQLIYKSNDDPDKDVLGADDGSGIFLALQMIEAKVPGCYVLHKAEECGGVGSSYLEAHHPEFLAQFDRAIAFDRAGYEDVITHQAMGRCCSDEFAEALAEQLNLGGTLEFKPSPDGVFTDTANYVGIIPECSNVSIGYFSQHGPQEYQDVEFLLKLRDALICVDWETLPTVRDPSKVESASPWWQENPVEDLKYMSGREILAWVRKSSAQDIAYALEDLLIELEQKEVAAEVAAELEANYPVEPYYEENWA